MNLILDFQGSTSTLIPFILDKFDNYFRFNSPGTEIWA